MVVHDDKFRVLRKLPEVRFEEELRGYSKQQVDRVLQSLAPLADDVATMQDRLAEAEARAASAEGRAASAEARLVELSSRQTAAGAPAPAVLAPVTPPPDFDETLSKTLLLAQRTADQTVAAAKAESEALLTSTRAEADAVRSEAALLRRQMSDEVAAERQQLQADAHADVQSKVAAAESSLAEAEGRRRDELVAEIGELIEQRDRLATDIADLEGHLSHRRDVIKAAVVDISALLDDPNRLRSEMPPAAMEAVEAPSPEPAAVLDVAGLDELAPHSASVSVDVESEGPLSSASEATAFDPPAATVSSSQTFGEAGYADTFGDVAYSDVFTGSDVVEPTAEVEGVASSVAHGSVANDEPDSGIDRFADDWSVDDRSPSIASEPTQAHAIVDDELTWEDAGIADVPLDTWGETVEPARDDRAETELARPAWADAVPEVSTASDVRSEDPFLDELRRSTGDNAETDAALERFLSDQPDDDDRRNSWFTRRK